MSNTKTTIRRGRPCLAPSTRETVHGVVAIAEVLGVSVATYYRWIRSKAALRDAIYTDDSGVVHASRKALESIA